jgi:hypothetical protein
MKNNSIPIAPTLGVGLVLALATPASALTFLGGTSFWSTPVGPGASVSGNVVYENQVGPPAGGAFLNPQPISLPSPNNINPSGVRFGDPASTFKSGLRAFGSTFNLVVPTNGTSVTATSIYVLDHINFPIFSGTQLTGVSWNLRLSFLDDSNNPFFVTSVIPVTIDETPNTPPCVYTAPPPNTPCPDRVTLTQPNTAIVGIPGTNEFINLQLQFPSTGTNSLITNENQQNLFPINGIFTRIPAPAPLGALGVLSFLAANFKRMRKRYSNTSRSQLEF